MKAGDFRNRTLAECESTNDLARTLGEVGEPSGTWVSARLQTRGRGRQGRSWLSEPGNLFLSMVLRGADLPLTWVPLLSAVAVVEAVRALRPDFPLSIKWPNDLVVHSDSGFAKCGGILCEGVGGKAESFVVVGVGLNCASAPETDQATASLGVSADALRPLLIAELAGIPTNRDSLRARYGKYSALQAGQAIEWSTVERPEELSSGVLLDLGPYGELRVRTEGGEKSLWSEEVRLRKAKIAK